jgi:hypothetical protein
VVCSVRANQFSYVFGAVRHTHELRPTTVAFANGAIYAQSARHIDQVVDDEFNLIALSFWLFVGDIGSVIGSNVLLYVCMLVEKLPWFSNQ